MPNRLYVTEDQMLEALTRRVRSHPSMKAGRIVVRFHKPQRLQHPDLLGCNWSPGGFTPSDHLSERALRAVNLATTEMQLAVNIVDR